jgi:hypothetical protein
MIKNELTLHNSINSKECTFIYGKYYSHRKDKNKRIMFMRRCRFKKIDFYLIKIAINLTKKFIN